MNQFLQQGPSEQWVHDDKMQLLLIKSHSTSAWTSARSDRRAEPVRQIGTPAPALVHIERSTRNAPSPQKESIQAQLAAQC
jgi:hypothetical protein